MLIFDIRYIGYSEELCEADGGACHGPMMAVFRLSRSYPIRFRLSVPVDLFTRLNLIYRHKLAEHCSGLFTTNFQ